MFVGGYFVTDEQEKAKRYDTRQRGLELKRHLATLRAELRDYSKAWSDLGTTFDNDDSKQFVFDRREGVIKVLRADLPQQPLRRGGQQGMNEVARVGIRYFTGDSLETLLSDIEATKKELQEVSRECAAMGDPL
jgi:hypothetical protein